MLKNGPWKFSEESEKNTYSFEAIRSKAVLQYYRSTIYSRTVAPYGCIFDDVRLHRTVVPYGRFLSTVQSHRTVEPYGANAIAPYGCTVRLHRTVAPYGAKFLQYTVIKMTTVRCNRTSRHIYHCTVQPYGATVQCNILAPYGTTVYGPKIGPYGATVRCHRTVLPDTKYIRQNPSFSLKSEGKRGISPLICLFFDQIPHFPSDLRANEGFRHCFLTKSLVFPQI